MNLSKLQQQFISFEKSCAGSLGIDALHIETNENIKFRAEEKFLMCSTYKLPMAICLLQQVEDKIKKLSDYLEITDFDLRPGISSTLNQLSYSVPLSVSIENLLQFMLQESCNTATDILLRNIGGPSAVMNFLQRSEISDMRIDRYTLEAISQWDGIKQLPADHKLTLDQYKTLEHQVSESDLLKAKEEFKKSSVDTTTPAAMTKLLVKLINGELLKKINIELLFKIMRGCKRGPLRLMGLLPQGTSVAHKTGTLTGYTCDVGVIMLPHSAGHVVISVYIKNSIKDLNNNERIIAEISRTLYDYFLFR